jgi:hypothetical protein
MHVSRLFAHLLFITAVQLNAEVEQVWQDDH